MKQSQQPLNEILDVFHNSNLGKLCIFPQYTENYSRMCMEFLEDLQKQGLIELKGLRELKINQVHKCAKGRN